MIKRIAIAVAFTLAPAAFAQTYIIPDADCGAITLHATRGTDFPNLGDAVAADQVKNAYLSNSPKPTSGFKGRRAELKSVTGPRSLDYATNTILEDGVVVASVELKPVVGGNETRTEHAKAFLFCGPAAPPADWQRSAGLGLEIYPQWNGLRSHLKTGDTMTFIAVDNTSNATSKLVRDATMELYRAGSGRVESHTADQQGMYKFRFPEPGHYMLTMTYRRPDTQQPEHWLVDTSTLTFEIK